MCTTCTIPKLLPASVIVKLLTRARVIYDVHENVREQIRNKYWIPRRLRGIVTFLYGFAEHVCLRWVDQVILAEDSYVDAYRRGRVTVVRNYPILPSAVASPEPRSYSDHPILGYCGVVAEIRGALEMIAVLAALRDRFPRAELRIIGPCLPEDLAIRMQALAADLDVADGLTLFGRMPLDRALVEVARCDIGLALLRPDPNYVSSLPTKMFEYMSLRMPVVVSDFPLWSSIVEGTECGIAVDPSATATIAARIGVLASDPREMRRLGENGRRAVIERYSWTAEERKLFAVYDALEGRTRAQSCDEIQDDTRNKAPRLLEVGPH